MSDRTLRSGDTPTGLRRKKSFQGHQYRRKTKPISEQYKAELSKVLGLTVKSNCAFACSEANENIAFPAGCVIVVCQVRKKKEFHIFNPGRKSLTCIHISLDGQYIVTGESGHLPCVRVFSVAERCQVASFQSHKFGVSCVTFSPDSRYIVSVGYQHDNVINVWNWRKNVLAASNKVSIKVRAVAFAEDASYFVTVGNRHVKFWYIDQSKIPGAETVPLKGRSGILDTVRHHLFCDVGCGVGSDNKFTYALSRTGMLCQFNEKRTLENCVQLEATTAYCLSVVNGIIVCGCGGGRIVLRSSTDLQLLGSFDSSDENSGPCDIVGVRMDSNNMWVHCVRNDHTVKIWDVIDFNCPDEYSSCSFHFDCVWDVKALPDSDAKTSSFYTCSNDNTVKLWNVEDCTCVLKNNIYIEAANSATTASIPKNGKVTGVRSLCVSGDARFLSAGDRNGVIHVFEMIDGTEHVRIAQVEMHSGDILSLAFNSSSGTLASASRDRCIYILDSNHAPTYTINDHSAAVTAVKFVHLDNKLRLISCGVDKSLYFCTVESSEGRVEIVRDQHIVEKHAMHDMTVVNDSVLVACGANLREYDIRTGKSLRFIRGSESVSTIIRVSTSSDATIIAFSCADKFIYVLNYISGECMLELGGHSEVCTALAFVNTISDMTLVTASADSCVFAWKLTRCAKIDDGGLSFQSQLTPTREENEQGYGNNTPLEDANTTAYFGDPVLNGSFGVISTPGTHVMIREKVDHGEESRVDGREKPEVAALDMDMSLPTWLTGEKDKVVKAKKPTGKWASRLQDQYDDVIFLDTPRTTMEWDDVNSDDPASDCDESEDEEGEEEEDEAKDSGLKQDSTQGDKRNSELINAEIIVSASLDATQDEYEMPRQGDASASTDYASAVDESLGENLSPAEKTCEITPKKFKSEMVMVLNSVGLQTKTGIDSSIEVNVGEAGYQSFLTVKEGLQTRCINSVNHAEMELGSQNHKNGETLQAQLEAVGDHTEGQSSQILNDGSVDHSIAQNHCEVAPENTWREKTNTGEEMRRCDAGQRRCPVNNAAVDVNPAASCGKEEQPSIPPAFADFLQNLGKKKPRATPTSLPVKSSYNFRSQNRIRTASDTVSLVLSTSTPNRQTSSLQTGDKGDDDHISGDTGECQGVVDELMTAYEKAESMYQRVSGEQCPNDPDAQSLLSNAFLSLKDRIDQLQLRMFENGQRTIGRIGVDNLPPVLSLLREYSDKLCCMVKEEIRKKSVVKE